MILASPSCGIAPSSGSGGEVHERNLLVGLAGRGHQPHILLAPGQRYPAALAKHVEMIRPRLPLRWWLAPCVLPSWIGQCWRAHRFDLLRAHSLRFLGPACVIAKRRYRITAPLVVTVHHWEPTRASERLERWVLGHADCVVVDSNFVVGQLREVGITPERMRVVPCGVGPEYRPGGTRQPIVLAMGPLVARKRPLVALRAFHQAFAKRSEMRFVWIGAGPLRSICEREVDRLGLGGRATFLGHVSEFAKRELLRSATVFLHASLLEGHPLSVLEAMASGAPVVARRAASLPEILDDGRAGWLAYDDDNLAMGLSAFVAGPLGRDEVARRGRARVRDCYAWDRTVERTEAVYRELVG